MTMRRSPSKRTGPGLTNKTATLNSIQVGLMGFAIAAARARMQKMEEEKAKYAESHGGHKVPRRKKGAGDGDKRTGR